MVNVAIYTIHGSYGIYIYIGGSTLPQNISTYTFRGLGIHFIQNVRLGQGGIPKHVASLHVSPACLF